MNSGKTHILGELGRAGSAPLGELFNLARVVRPDDRNVQ